MAEMTWVESRSVWVASHAPCLYLLIFIIVLIIIMMMTMMMIMMAILMMMMMCELLATPPACTSYFLYRNHDYDDYDYDHDHDVWVASTYWFSWWLTERNIWQTSQKCNLQRLISHCLASPDTIDTGGEKRDAGPSVNEAQIFWRTIFLSKIFWHFSICQKNVDYFSLSKKNL